MLLVAMPFVTTSDALAPSSFLFLVPFATSSFLLQVKRFPRKLVAPRKLLVTSKARSYVRSVLAPSSDALCSLQKVEGRCSFRQFYFLDHCFVTML